MTKTENGADTNATTTNDLVDVFARIGSSRSVDISNDFLKAYLQDADKAMRMLFWARDIREGAGERETPRKIMLKLEEQYPTVLAKVLHLVPEYGRFDDLLIFKTKLLKDRAYEIIKAALHDGNGLAAKWMPRKGKTAVELTKYLDLTPKKYRKLLVGLTKVVETQMCAKEFDKIDFSHVPSVASARYQRAFGKRAPEKYGAYLAALEKGETIEGRAVKINAGAVFPHDVIRSFETGNVGVAEQQWKALPNFAGAKNILPIVDTSGSMTVSVSGSIQAIHVAMGLGLYIAEKQESDFKDVIMTYSDDSRLVKLTGASVYSKYKQMPSIVGSTNIQAAYDNILKFAKDNKVPKKDMPEYLLIISDMEFNQGVTGETNHETATKKFDAAGYKLPKIIYWNVNARNAQYPVTTHDANTCLISGYSPAIMKAVLTGELEQFSPEGVMNETLASKRYDAVSKALKG